MIDEKAIQDLSTFGEIQLREVMAIEIKEIESIEDCLVRPAVPSPSPKGTLESAEARLPLLIQDDSLSIENHRCTEVRGLVSDRRKAIGPIVAATREDPYAAWFNMNGET
ncbi:hypothetical protein FHT83_004417, partial [Rhizobium sp. BK284]|nr:hypothetical protein [Rhizobium sp. BK284]